MNNSDPKELAAARMLILDGLDKLRFARDRLSMQKNNEASKSRAYELHRVIEAIAYELDKL